MNKYNCIENLLNFRKSLSLSQQEMASKMKISLSMYEKVEGGRASVSGNFMRSFKIAFPSVSIDYIFFASNSNISADISSG